RRGDGSHTLPEVLAQCPGELLTRLGPPARDPDLVEIEEVVQHRDVPPGGPARSEVTEHPATRPGEVFGAECSHGARAGGRDHGAIDDAYRGTGVRVV